MSNYSSNNEADIVAYRFAEAVKAKKIENEKNLSDFAISEHKRLTEEKIYYTDRLRYLEEEIKRVNDTLNNIPGEIESIPEKVQAKRAQYESGMPDFERITMTNITSQVKFEFEKAARDREALEKAEWASNV